MGSFEKDGYCVVRGMLSRQESADLRQQIVQLSGIGDQQFGTDVFECPDGVSRHRILWPMITHPRLIREIRSLLGDEIRYTQHSDIHVHRSGGWHRDCACRQFGTGPDWDESQEPYRVVRVAIYLQSFEESGSQLGVVPGSHRYERHLTDDEWRLWLHRWQKWTLFNRVRRKLGLWHPPEAPERSMTMWTDPDVDLSNGDPSFPEWIRTEPGDCVIFDQRLYHSASPLHGPKYAVYLSYSPENHHSRNHMGYYRYFREDLGYSDLDPELVERLEAENLFMAAPPPETVDGFFRDGLKIVS